MSFIGKLEEFQTADLFHIIASNRKGGKLNLTRRDAEGVVVFRGGKIIYAASTAARETLGNLLVHAGLITEDQLLNALELQHSAAEERRLGTILVDLDVLSQEHLEQVVRSQIGKVIAEFLEWQTGFFKFELVNFEDRGEIEVSAEDFLLREGLAPDQILSDLSARLDQLESKPPRATTNVDVAADSLTTLKEVIEEIRSPEFKGEVTKEILEFARRSLPRALLFSVSRRNFKGMGQFGLDTGEASADDYVRRIKIPLGQPSVLAQAADMKTTYRGPLDPIEWNLYLMSQLGAEPPTEAVALPLVVNQSVLLVLYGDNAPDHKPIGPLHELELLILQAGLAMEKRMLEQRIARFEKIKGSSQPALDV